ncbi:single-strand binding protein [Cutibacterium acnes JCM 18909]|nr:single-strand binding protein [Cutibacterium acnes JCM 18909]
MDANVSFTGNLGTDVEMKIGEGWRGARFRVAHTPRVMRQGEWVDGTTTWMSVHVYGRLADNCHVSLRKGDPVMVTGRLRTRSWIDDEAPTSNSLSLHIMLDRTYPGCLPCVVDPRNAPKLPWAMIE